MCLLCCRSGDEINVVDAIQRHTNMLLADKQANELMSGRFKGWVGPKTSCNGKLVFKPKSKVRGRRVRSLVFGEVAGDPWVEIGARIKVNGKIEEGEEIMGKAFKESTRQLPPQLLDVKLHTYKRQRVVVMLEEAWQLKSMLSEKVDDEVYDPKFHIVRRFDELKQELAEIQAAEGQELGLRHGSIMFNTVLVAGRKTLDKDLLKQNLLSAGLDAEKVQEVIELSTKEGTETWRKTVQSIE